MLNKKENKRFIKRIKEYNNNTSEKEIETEFYRFIGKYYENKYTDNGAGIINYTAPYNIDGLLEIRTLDTDYRILVEAKASKDFTDSKTRNEVLAQAIYYCQKLNHYDELLPAVILLIEKSSMIVINTSELTEFVTKEYNGLNASGAYKTDGQLINTLNNTAYDYEYYEFNDKTDYNEMFDLVDNFGLASVYRISKTRDFTSDNHMIIFNDFTSKYSNIRYYNGKNDYKYVSGKWFTYENDEWNESSTSIITRLLLDFIKGSHYRIVKLDVNYLLGLIKDYYTVSSIEHIRFNNCVLNINNGEVSHPCEDYFYTQVIDHDFKRKNLSGFNILSFSELLTGDKKFFIQTNSDNYPAIAELCFMLNLTVASFNEYNDSRVIVFDNSSFFKCARG